MNAAEFLKTLRTLRRSHGKRSGPASVRNLTLTPAQLAARWKGAYSVGTLANWRANPRDPGPSFTKIAGRVLYPLQYVEAFEKSTLAEYAR